MCSEGISSTKQDWLVCFLVAHLSSALCVIENVGAVSLEIRTPLACGCAACSQGSAEKWGHFF